MWHAGGFSPVGLAADIALPNGPEEAALELAFIEPGVPPREVVAVRVLANGTVQVPGQPAAAAPYRMAPDRLQKLMHELLVAGQIERMDTAAVRDRLRQACAAAGLSADIEGAAATVIRFRTAKLSGEVRCDALSVMAARFPDLLEVQRLHDAQLRLQNVAAIAQAGGEEASEQLAEIANRTLQTTHPDAPRLTHRDLSMFRELSTGSRYVQFYRRSSESGELLVSVFQTPGQPARVSVTAQPN